MLDFLAGGGRTGALMRSHDWTRSPLGAPESWPHSLRTVVGLLLQSQFPMFVAWGNALGFLYNDAYAEILGAKHPAALGSRFQDIWSEIWADISPLIDAAMAGEATYRQDLPLVMNRKGYDEQTWFTFSYSPVRNDRGEVAGMFCAVEETTRRVLAERGLRELNETLERRVSDALAERKLLADIVEGTNAFVQVVDLDFRWLAINKAAADEFERIFGKRPQVGASMLDTLADRPQHQAAIRAIWARALAGEEFATIDEFGDPSRDRRLYEMRFNTLRDATGAQIGAYQFVYDVTERVRDQERLRHAEQALRQSQRLESLGQLTGGVAHDFNNLLAVFASGIQVLERHPSPEQERKIMDAMRRAVSRGTGLTRHLLAFSRRKPVNPESIDLASYLRGMREMLASSLRGDIQVEMHFDDGLWHVEVDTGELELAIVNLCVNARDAMPDGGTITIAGANIVEPASDGASAELVRLRISDTGNGIPPPIIGRVFDPFFTTKDVGKGSGLGLAQVYGFAQQSGGRVSIASDVGVGTVVTLLLPRAARAPAAADAATPPLPAVARFAKHRGDVLLVEDDLEVAALTREMLAALGFGVIHASHPAAALASLSQARSLEAVLSDIMMPGGTSGLHLAREIRVQNPTLPIVLATGYADASQGMRDGEFRLLLKPYSLEALADALGVETEAIPNQRTAARDAS